MKRHLNNSCKAVGNPDKIARAAAENRVDAIARMFEEQQVRIAALEAQLLVVAKPPVIVGCVGGEAIIESVRALTISANAATGGVVNQVVNNVQENHIHILVFGKEDSSHITRAAMGDLLAEAQVEGGADSMAVSQAAVRKTGRRLYCERPENLTAYQGNKREKEAVVRGVDQWEVRALAAVMQTMTVAAINVIFDKQPLDAAGRYDALLKALADQEPELVHSALLQDQLRQNKKLIMEALGHCPKAGSREGVGGEQLAAAT